MTAQQRDVEVQTYVNTYLIYKQGNKGVYLPAYGYPDKMKINFDASLV